MPCLLLFSLFCLSAPARRCAAKPEFLATAKQTYAIKSGGTIDSASCSLCHAASGPPTLNLYGTSLKGQLTLMHARAVTPEILHALDNQDADGDGFTNLDEFKADTLPGDATSHPAGKPPPPAAAPTAAAATPSGGEGELSPFDLKSIFLAKHAQHPVLVHFPIALFMISVLFDLLAVWKKNTTLAMVGYYNLLTAGILALPTVATGLIAWQWQYGGAALKGNLLLHLIFGLTSTGLIWLLWFMRSRQKKTGAEFPNAAYLALAVVAALVVALTGHIGGILSGVVTAAG